MDLSESPYDNSRTMRYKIRNLWIIFTTKLRDKVSPTSPIYKQMWTKKTRDTRPVYHQDITKKVEESNRAMDLT